MGLTESTGYERKRLESWYWQSAGRLSAVLRAVAFLAQFVLLPISSIRKIAVAAVIVGLALAPLPVGSMHSELSQTFAEAADGLETASQFDLAHGHSHDDDAAEHRSDSHTPGHDAADHSHQFAFLLPAGGHQNGALLSCWSRLETGLPDPAHCHGLERPPRLPLSI